MKPQKIKRYRLSVSRIFPATHPRKGEPTNFREKIYNAIYEKDGDWSNAPGPVSHYVFEPDFSIRDKKLHTCRANYDLWAKRMAEVQAGRAVIELCYWSDKPYRSKQVVFATIDKDSGCGVQKLVFFDDDICCPYAYEANGVGNHAIYDIDDLAKNDGLSIDDFKSWFKGYDLSQPMAIIHFTDFRY